MPHSVKAVSSPLPWKWAGDTQKAPGRRAEDRIEAEAVSRARVRGHLSLQGSSEGVRLSPRTWGYNWARCCCRWNGCGCKLGAECAERECGTQAVWRRTGMEAGW